MNFQVCTYVGQVEEWNQYFPIFWRLGVFCSPEVIQTISEKYKSIFSKQKIPGYEM